MITRDQIILEVYNNNLIKKFISSFKPRLVGFEEDFEQHIYTVLCELSDDKVIGMYERGELQYYLYYVSKAQAFNDKSDFWALHKGRLDIDYSIDDENYKEPQEEDED